MGSHNIKDVLTSFSPSLDYCAITSGDGRIKIWDTLKGQIQAEFADIMSTDATDSYPKPERGHLSVDYTCMKWMTFDRKKKRKLVCSLLVLGTGGGDVLAFDIRAGQLKWRVSDCHPGGVSDISFSACGSCIYVVGADGMICKIDYISGELLGKFKASAKAIFSMSVSPDGKILATAAAQLKIFNCSDQKKIQKFSGHPGAVRCMIFTEDGKFILSSAVGERYVAVWRIDGSKNRSACCVLAMEHPAVFLDSRCMDNGGVDADLYVLAISELGVCYLWYGKTIEELRIVKPTKISLSLQDNISKNHKVALPSIFAAKLQGVVKPASCHVFVAYGLLIKPLFQKLLVHSGTDIKLNSSQDGVLLPNQSHISEKRKDSQNGVTALDRANAEDALLPIPKIFVFHEKKKRQQTLVDSKSQAKSEEGEGDMDTYEVDTVKFCMEDQLRSLGIIGNKDDLATESTLNSTLLKGINLEANVPQKKMRAAVLSITPCDACKLLTVLVDAWQSRLYSGKYVLPWIYNVLVCHGHSIASHEPASQVLDFLYKSIESKRSTIQSLLQLSGRFQLVTAQIDKVAQNKTPTFAHDHQSDEEEEEQEDEVDDFLYGLDDDVSQSSSDDED
ncbi:uncharacterized protein LOC131150757 [Malania oleifera]|uniref:uncharacterized protein LOC131150757 n=1 Tax=Malania oleifera TaxID=397392 RepID=UPI0025ADAF17|nr:uncharacterized protein LOC131150757 [Malania oleifera]